jgi:hypothetical protein
MRDATLTLYDPTRRETVRVGGNQRTPAADFDATFAYYPEPGLLVLKHPGWAAGNTVKTARGRSSRLFRLTRGRYFGQWQSQVEPLCIKAELFLDREGV